MPNRLAAVVSGAAFVAAAACSSAVAVAPTPAPSPVASDPAWSAGLSFNAHGVSRVTARELGKSWRPGCPVGPKQLRALLVTYWDFQRHRRTGILVVNVAAVPAVRAAFARMARARFPINGIVPVAAFGGSDNRSMEDDNTSGFNCRYAVTNGPKTWSEHAYGEAVDIDPRENPYRLDGRVLPPSGAGYINRSKHRRGMIFPNGPVVAAWDSVGWGWGGRWSSTPDYQHFSVNGR